MSKITKGILIALASLLALVLLCVGLYSIGYLDVFIIFFLIPGAILAAIICFIVNLRAFVRAKRENLPVPQGKIVALAVSTVFLICVFVSVVALIAVFAMAIAFM